MKHPELALEQTYVFNITPGVFLGSVCIKQYKE